MPKPDHYNEIEVVLGEARVEFRGFFDRDPDLRRLVDIMVTAAESAGADVYEVIESKVKR